ncbi:hypothetical protein [Neobacillus sp. LXY-1]
MAKNKNRKSENNPALMKTDVEFATSGFEKKAMQAQERKKK